MSNKIRILSDGKSNGTKVFACDRENGVDVQINNITKIEILPIQSGGLLKVRIDFVDVELDLMADLVE
ncbi:MAG: hypothetical protein NTX56_02695 [Proteobacteria bacterium]|nr:hypothetical protein [Pseudomonadota bacterium]